MVFGFIADSLTYVWLDVSTRHTTEVAKYHDFCPVSYLRFIQGYSNVRSSSAHTMAYVLDDPVALPCG